jgi:hypothetical protein
MYSREHLDELKAKTLQAPAKPIASTSDFDALTKSKFGSHVQGERASRNLERSLLGFWTIALMGGAL